MPDYSKAKIYKVCGGEMTYFGSTIQELANRFSIHKNDKKIGKHLSINQILDLPDCKIELVENYPCISKQELLQREKFYIDNYPCINYKKPIVSIEEAKQTKKLYQQTHKEMNAVCCKKWEDKNKEKRKEYHRIWYLKKKNQSSFLI
jgi:hypothetical protein